MRILVIHGPNLNMLGIREPHIYGTMTMAEIDDRLRKIAQELGDVELECFQSNHEGAIVDLIQQRLVKAVLAKKPQPYTNDELAALASHATEMEDASQKVERQMRKVIAAGFLQGKIGQTFDAIVTGVTKSGTFARPDWLRGG